MASKESFLLRIDPKILDALRRWASDEFRSANGQLEFLIRRALIEEGRLKKTDGQTSDDDALEAID